MRGGHTFGAFRRFARVNAKASTRTKIVHRPERVCIFHFSANIALALDPVKLGCYFCFVLSNNSNVVDGLNASRRGNPSRLLHLIDRTTQLSSRTKGRGSTTGRGCV